MSDPNPEPSWFETCTVLVFYGLNSEDEDPDPASPSLALGNLGEPDRLFKSDLPPILSVQTRESFEQELAQAAENAGQDEMCLAAIHKISKWLSKTAPPYVAYELEPPDMAGFSTAFHRGAELMDMEVVEPTPAPMKSSEKSNFLASLWFLFCLLLATGVFMYLLFMFVGLA